jgi:hypothetical protein
MMDETVQLFGAVPNLFYALILIHRYDKNWCYDYRGEPERIGDSVE